MKTPYSKRILTWIARKALYHAIIPDWLWSTLNLAIEAAVATKNAAANPAPVTNAA